MSKTYYLLKYIDEASYRNWDMLFRAKISAMKYAIEDHSYDEFCPDIYNLTLEEKIKHFEDKGVYPLSTYVETGCGYYSVGEIVLHD